jgi:hypothetical protein
VSARHSHAVTLGRWRGARTDGVRLSAAGVVGVVHKVVKSTTKDSDYGEM